LYFNIDIDVFQGRFPILSTNALPKWLDGEAAWEDWTAVPAFVKLLMSSLDSKTQQIV
jgi:hypothetical protein